VIDSVWNRAQRIFLQAVDLPPAERAAFLRHACAGDRALLDEVESLLAHDVPETEIHDVFQFAAATLVEDGSLTGQRIGPWRIVRELGHGGMGTVYLAVRDDDEYRKEVAIKVVKRGMDTQAMLDRFRYERQILAGLDHPYVARLLDGGSTAGHQPFFVMEYVQGRAIDRFCAEEKLNAAGICRLFLLVCDAVAYAHRNLVVHRDLKPSNIVVTAEGAPKLLDFGVAKLLDAQNGDAATGVFPRPLTPEYASPEQARGQAVTTAADVYSLGAVLYELLTGSRVQDAASPRRPLRGDIDKILLMALREEPERRYSSVEQFAGDIRRYLDGLPVLARQDSLRYRAGKYIARHRVGIAAAALVAVSLIGGAALALSEARVARAAQVVAEQERARAEKERIRAEERTRQAEAERAKAETEHHSAEHQAQRAEQRLSEMVYLANKSLFDVHMAIERLPGSTEARRKLVETTLSFLQSLEKEAGDDPRLRIALGAAYLRAGEVQGSPNAPSLGDMSSAAKSLDRGAMWMKPLVAARPNDPNVLAVWIDLRRARAEILEANGQSAEGVRVLKGLLPAAAELSRLSPDDGREANLHQVLVAGLAGDDPAEALVHARLGVEGFAKLHATHPEDVDTALALSSTHSLWGSLLRARDSAQALVHYRESARIREELIAKHPNNSAVLRELMLVYGQMASVLGDSFQLIRGTDVEGARVYYTKAAVIAHQLADADPVNRIAQYDVASVELRLGALDPQPGTESESLASLERARGIFETLLRSEPQAVRYNFGLELSWEYIGHRLRAGGKPAEALAAYRASLSLTDKTLAANPRDLSSLIQAIAVDQDIASLMADTGDRAGALDYAARAVDQAERIAQGNDTPNARIRLAKAYESMAEVRKRLGDWADARAAATLAADHWRKFNGGDSHAADVARMERFAADCDAHIR